MSNDIWTIMTGAQVSTALVLIAGALVYIAVKLSPLSPRPSSKGR